MRAELLRRVADGVCTLLRHEVAHFRAAQYFRGFEIQFADDIPRRAGRCKKSVPRIRIEAGDAGFLYRRYFRQDRHAMVGTYRQCAQFAGADLR